MGADFLHDPGPGQMETGRPQAAAPDSHCGHPALAARERRRFGITIDLKGQHNLMWCMLYRDSTDGSDASHESLTGGQAEDDGADQPDDQVAGMRPSKRSPPSKSKSSSGGTDGKRSTSSTTRGETLKRRKFHSQQYHKADASVSEE